MKTTFRFYLFLFIFSSFISFRGFSQAPEISADYSFGGTKDDFGNLQKTLDGGYISCGSSYSNNGDVSGHHGFLTVSDLWVVKFDSLLNILWQKSVGGAAADYAAGIKQAEDGNYFLAAATYSVDGDMTTNYGELDYWLCKMDAGGNILWQKNYGGTKSDFGRSIQLTPDGGCIFIGDSHSNDTDVSGHHGSTDHSDCWIVKLNSDGIIEWQKSIGGSEVEIPLSVIVETDGYVIGGYTFSNDGDISGNHGLYDYMAFKLSLTGDLIWSKCYGGTDYDSGLSIGYTNDGNYIMSGGVESNDGQVTGHHGSTAHDDAWIIKIDSMGNEIWQKSYGGTQEDDFRRFINVSDGYIFYGSTTSTDDDISFNHGKKDCWLVKIDFLGNIVWEKTYGGANDESIVSVIEQDDYSLLIANYTTSIDGDISFNHGATDYWIIKTIPLCILVAELCNTLDDNCNGLIDDGITETISISAGGPTTFCQGSSTTLTASYSGATVQWKKDGVNITGATSANYTVTKKGNYTCVTTSPCGTATSSIINVTVNKNPNASISAGGATTFCAGGSVTLTEVPSGGCTYQWYKGASAIAGATTTNYIATTTGNYKCRVTKTATGCYKNSNAIAVSVPCRESELSVVNGESGFTIYPNPVNDKLNIQINSQLLSPFSFLLTITDLEGREIYSSELNSLTTEINISDFASGMYFVKVIPIAIGRGEEMIGKFIKN